MEGSHKLESALGNALVRIPLRVEHGWAVAPDRPGFGIEWNEEALTRVTVP